MDRRSGHIRALLRKMLERKWKKCPFNLKWHMVILWVSRRWGITPLTSILFHHDQVKTPSKHDSGPEYNSHPQLQKTFLGGLSNISEQYIVISFVSKDLPGIVLDSAQIHSLKPIYTQLTTSWQPFLLIKVSIGSC